MGQMWTAYVTHSDTAPDLEKLPTFDPLYGFPDGRKERVMVATQEEMNKARVPLEKRDYCAHLYMALMKCRRDTYPWFNNCKHEKHEYEQCEYDDYVMRMKEYERERRLLERAKRKRLKEEREKLKE
ncbi:NADH dehydrogenase [ubiquinone] 1 beta subcomplex subunit 7-like [Ptychodera flava]|uniref:NADH dehydrogenase [ubiquinone] 1 beta subcomplex subunit 7-like n=1 Tax=Ptychodera flava TaxID=63121 RepID=UPI00396A4E5B